MNILLLNPPYFPKYSRSQRSPGVIRSGTIYYPIWLAYATGVLEKEGFAVKLVDAPAAKSSLEQVLELVENFQPTLVVIDTSTPSIYNDVKVAEAIKNKQNDAFIALVGPHVTALPAESLALSKQISAVARGEYDYTLLDLAKQIDSGGDLSTVLGLSYQTLSGEIVHNEDRPLIQDLDAIPFVSAVYKRHLHVEDYFYSITQYPEVAIVTGRGCPYQCTYCVWPQLLTGHAYRKRSTANVVEEFEYIAREFPQVKEVFIEDDTLTMDRKRSVELARALVKHGNRLPFTANSRADVDYQTLKELKMAGLRLLCVGFESGDAGILKNIKKNITVNKFFEFRQAAKSANVLVHGCFMAGNPGETRATLQTTLDLAIKLSPDTAQFFPVMVYPGTESYQWFQDHHYLKTENFSEWLTDEGLHKNILGTAELTSKQLSEWCDQARHQFYLRPAYILNKIREMAMNPREIKRITKAGLSFGRYLLRSRSRTA